MPARKVQDGKVRYAVVGAGWISQAAVMPAFAQTGNSELVALVTEDPKKGEILRQRYGLAHVYSYDHYHELLRSDVVDAIYMGLPNWMHHDYTVPALEAGLHVLLEKPMAVSEAECRAIEEAAKAAHVRLMIGYRLHFEPATLEAIRLVRSGEIGDPRIFTSVFCQHVAATNHRAKNGFWAGPVADMGPYPINAARNLFGAEPIEVMAMGARNLGLPFDFDDTVAVTLRFPEDRIAQFTVSYGANSVGEYRVTGQKGDVSAEPGFTFGAPIKLRVTRGDKTHEITFDPTDQFGGELKYFSDCILEGRDPEPDGEEGRLDVRVVAAIERALKDGEPQMLEPVKRGKRPDPAQALSLPPVEAPDLVDAAEPGKG
jgi:predicted dehydrogenase